MEKSVREGEPTLICCEKREIRENFRVFGVFAGIVVGDFPSRWAGLIVEWLFEQRALAEIFPDSPLDFSQKLPIIRAENGK